MKQLPLDLSSKIKQSLQTIGNNANPKMEILVTRAKDTIVDNTYWTVESIREISGLGDVSVAPRRLRTHGQPDRIYEIHIRNGEVYTSIREYPDKLREGFKTQFSLGPGTSVGVAFNGNWERYRKFYRLTTEDKPWASWVDGSGVLWVQRWDDASSKFQLSTNVVKVKMIRAWKNLVIHHQDQGIVVAYIKTDGKVYYRNYCIQEDYSEAWEYEKELTSFTGSAVNVNLFITNDYRTGFIIEDNAGKIHWLVTHRNWGGMASPAENLASGIKDLMVNVIPIKYHEFETKEHITTGVTDLWLNVAEPIYPTVISADNGDEAEERIWLHFSHPPVGGINELVSALTIKDKMGAPFSVHSVERDLNDSACIILNTARFTSMNTNLTITYDRSKFSLNAENQGSLFAIDSFALPFIPLLTPPEGYSTENIAFGISPKILVTQVYYSKRDITENLPTGISNINIVVTKVGYAPL